MLTVPDHLFAFLIGIVLPLHGFPTWQRLKRDIYAGKTGARMRLYIRTFLIEWVLAFCVLILFYEETRSLKSIGVAVHASTRFVVILAIVLIASIGLFIQWQHVLGRRGNFPPQYKKKFGSLAGLIPQTHTERTWFGLLSVTSGICEELLYRGFLIWYLEFHFQEITAAMIALILFTIGHGYQGASGLKKTFVAGGILTVFYLVSGSLIPSMILHASVNFTSGLIGSEILKYSQESA